MKKAVKIIIGGDLGPTKSNYKLFSEGNIESLVDHDLLALLFSADYRIFNLEVPLTDKEDPIIKDGPNLIAPASTVNGLKKLNPLVLGMGNNHILDQDEEGLFQSMKVLSENNILYTGSGRNLEEAAIPLIIEIDGIRIGIYACAENEFSIAKHNHGGANPFDPLDSPDHITELKTKSDFVIVLYHGGKEYYRFPSPNLQKLCRKMADKGADLVICQHSHCIGCMEKYGDTMIVYGQGNFLFDRHEDEFWNTGLLIQAAFGEGMTVEFIPLSKNGNGVKLASQNEGDLIISDFKKRSEQITVPGFVDTEYEKFCKGNASYYLSTTAGLSRILRKIDEMTKGSITQKIYSTRKLFSLQNTIESESIRELLLKSIEIRKRLK